MVILLNVNEVMIKQSLLKNLPGKPGVYLFKNEAGGVLYAGKAKVLRTRVRSYFRPQAQLDEFKKKMVSEVREVETIVCDSEYEALMLEANLIRRHRPPYNIIMMDDKRYLYVKVTKEKWPKVFAVRRVNNDGAKYFGPYSSSRSVRQTLRLLQRLFPHRTDRDLESKWIFPHPLFKNADEARKPVSNLVENGRYAQEDYGKNIEHIIQFLKGERDSVRQVLTDGMKVAADAQQFERAAIWRDQLEALNKMLDKQKVLWPQSESFDCISVAKDKTRSAVNVFSIRGGSLAGKNSWLMKHRGGVTREDVVRQFLLQYYQAVLEQPTLILMPVELSDAALLKQWLGVKKLLVPKRGRKRQLINMGEMNAKQMLLMERAQDDVVGRWQKASEALAQALGLKSSKLKRIETYDIASTQGKLATGAMVVFSDGQPLRNQYRKFRVKLESDKPDDYAALAQVMERRFSGRHESWAKPDLVLIDGGKGQLGAVLKVLRALGVTVPVASVAKREELLFVPDKPAAIQLPYDNDALLLVQRMRDEAHRVTNSYHKLLRSKKQQKSIFDEIPGVGPVLKRRLLNKFGSLRGVRDASEADLVEVVGVVKAKTVRNYL